MSSGQYMHPTEKSVLRVYRPSNEISFGVLKGTWNSAHKNEHSSLSGNDDPTFQ